MSKSAQFSFQTLKTRLCSGHQVIMLETTIILAILAFYLATAKIKKGIFTRPKTLPNYKHRRLMYLTNVFVVLMQFASAEDCTDIQLHILDPKAIKLYVGQQASYYTVPQLYENDKACSIEYTVAIQPDDKLLIQFDAMSNNITWSSPMDTDTGVYNVTLYSANNQTCTDLFVLTMTVSAHRALTSVPVVATPITNRDYKITTNTLNTHYLYHPLFIPEGNNCGTDNVYYKLSITSNAGQDTSFIFLKWVNSVKIEIHWFTSDVTLAGIYTITLTGYLPTTVYTPDPADPPYNHLELKPNHLNFSCDVSGGTTPASTTFILSVQVIITCATTSQTITIYPTTITSQTVKTQSAASSIIFTAFQVAYQQYCTASHITYTATITSDNSQSISFITFDPTTRQISWTTPQSIGEYTVQVTGTITNIIGNKVASTNFLLKVVSCQSSTDQITLLLPSLTDPIELIYQSGPGSKIIPAFSLTSQYCINSDIIYSCTITVTTNVNTNQITFDQNSLQISWNQQIMVGVYTATISAAITNAADTFVASVTQAIIVNCPTTDWSKKIVSQEKDYILGQQLQVEIPDFITTYCSSVTTSIYTENAQLLQTIKLTQTNDFTCASLLELSTDDATLIGTHNITIFCTEQTTNDTRKIKVTLNIYHLCSNAIIYPNVIKDQSYILGNKINPIYWQNFETSSVSCNKIEYTVKFISDSGINIENWFEADSKHQKITVKQLDQTLSVKSSVNVTVFGLINGKSYLPQTLTQFKIMILPNTDNTGANNTVAVQNQEFQQETNNSRPLWQSITTDHKGGVTICFSKSLIIPQNYQNINSTQLEVKIIPFDLDNLQYLNFTWTISDFTNTYLTLQLNFQNPLYVSANGVYKLDRVYVKVKDTQLFTSDQSKLEIKQQTSCRKSLPPQLSSNKNENQALYQLTNVLNTGSKAITVSTLVVNLMMASSLALLWGMINAIQIINMLTSFNLYIPANVLHFFGFMSDISNFNFINSAKVFDWLGFPQIITDENLDRLLQGANQTQSTQNTQDEVVGEQNVFRQLGATFLMFLCGIMLIVIHILIYLLTKIKSTQRIARELLKKIKHYLFWNSTSRYFSESYFPLALQVVQYFKTVKTNQYFATRQSSVETIFMMLIGLIVVFGPYSTTLYLYYKFKEFRRNQFKQRFGEIMDKLNWRYSSSCNFISIFCYRRLVQVSFVVFLVHYSYAQVQLMVMTSILVIIVFGCSNVYFLPRDRRLEYFNEATILLCVYHCFILTDFVPEPEARYFMGYSMIAATLFNFIVNAYLLVLDTIMQIVKVYKQMRKQYRFWVHKIKVEERSIQISLDRQMELNAIQIQNQIPNIKFKGLSKVQFKSQQKSTNAQQSINQIVLQDIQEVSQQLESDQEMNNNARVKQSNKNIKIISNQKHTLQKPQQHKGSQQFLIAKQYKQRNLSFNKPTQVKTIKNDTVCKIGNFNQISKLIQEEEKKIEQVRTQNNVRIVQKELAQIAEFQKLVKLERERQSKYRSSLED